MKIFDLKVIEYDSLIEKCIFLDSKHFSRVQHTNEFLKLKSLDTQIREYYEIHYDIKLKDLSLYGKDIKYTLLILLLILYEKKHLDIEDNIKKYISTFIFNNRNSEKEKIKRLKNKIKALKEEIERIHILHLDEKVFTHKENFDERIFLKMEEEINTLRNKLEVENRIILSAWIGLQEFYSKN